MPADLRLAAASLFALCAPNLFAIQNYSIVDVGVLVGSPGAGVSDINNSGTIVGYTNPPARCAAIDTTARSRFCRLFRRTTKAAPT
jgi:hypothetical protein